MIDVVMLMLGIAGIFAGIFLSLAAVGVFTNEARGVSKSLAVHRGLLRRARRP